MKYIALLRGVNVGGKSSISMSAIKTAFEHEEFKNVSTYINSGNVFFESEEKDVKKLTHTIEAIFETQFFPIDTVIFSVEEIKKVVKNIPKSWKEDDVRKYVAFVIPPTKPAEIIPVIKLREDVDFIDSGEYVIYMTTKMSGLTKSGFSKFASHPLYKKVTIRNFNTVQKILSRMELE
jgi:uncharacterized protein (DUF1697 family)